MKKLIQDNLGPIGGLNNDRFSRAILYYRNTPDRDMGHSPAKMIYGQVLRDCMPITKGSYKSQRE